MTVKVSETDELGVKIFEKDWEDGEIFVSEEKNSESSFTMGYIKLVSI